MFSSMARSFANAFTHGVPDGTKGAFVRYESRTAIGLKLRNSSPSFRSSMR